jgi:hypothetical protein
MQAESVKRIGADLDAVTSRAIDHQDLAASQVAADLVVAQRHQSIPRSCSQARVAAIGCGHPGRFS